MSRKRKDKKKKRPGRLRRWGLKAVLVCLISQAVYLTLLHFVNPPLTLTQLGALIETKGMDRESADISRISEHALLAVMAAEDQRFPRHNGFDWQSVHAAIRGHEPGQGRLRGASTISQQVAKNIFLWQGRSWIRKGMEAYFTVLLELTMDKRRILELYLNVAEMGRGIFGIEAAAKRYFHKSARTLTPREAALIAACLPNPKRYRPDRPTAHINAKADWILGQMQYLRSLRSVQSLIR